MVVLGDVVIALCRFLKEIESLNCLVPISKDLENSLIENSGPLRFHDIFRRVFSKQKAESLIDGCKVSKYEGKCGSAAIFRDKDATKPQSLVSFCSRGQRDVLYD